jgi:hypothetical protein
MPKAKQKNAKLFLLALPTLQLSFADALRAARENHLQDALGRTVSDLDLPTIDSELAIYADKKLLSKLAAKSLRGELVSPVPVILLANPKLLGYYRLLLGYSQKEFYGTATGLASFKSAEEGKGFRAADLSRVPDLCTAMGGAAAFLIAGLDESDMTPSMFDDLTLLTLGPQLRGGANVKKGAEAILIVFQLIREIVKASIVTESATQIVLKNSSHREVLIEFASDPDIKIVERLDSGKPRNVIAIEIKGGTDVSNIHNRIGEAEKSHQNAKKAGFIECWTIVNVAALDGDKAKQESPSTNHFFDLGELQKPTSAQATDFRSQLVSLAGIKLSKRPSAKK